LGKQQFSSWDSKLNDTAAQLKTFNTLSCLSTHIVVGIGDNDLGVADTLIQGTRLTNLAAVTNKLKLIKPQLVAINLYLNFI
jgi:hypothetical protein